MDFFDLTDVQIEKLFGIISRYLMFQHELIQRMQAQGFPREDQLYRATRESVLAMRELYLTLNDSRRKGVSHQAGKRAKWWPAV